MRAPGLRCTGEVAHLYRVRAEIFCAFFRAAVIRAVAGKQLKTRGPSVSISEMLESGS